MRKAGIAATVFLALLAGLFAGVRWHTQIGESLGWEPTAPAAEKPAQASAEEYWTCSMHPEVRQPGPGLCPICHMRLEKKLIQMTKPEPGEKPAKRKILYWWDPMMNPPYTSDRPGKSPMGMDLVPRYEEEVSGFEIHIDPTVVQNMGIRFAPVTAGPLKTAVRAFGTLVEAQPLQHDVSLKIGGWIERLYADREGMRLSKGDPLFDVYSPDLVVAQDEFLSAARSLDERTDKNTPARIEAEKNIENARSKLKFWDVPESEIEAIRKEGKARRAITFRSAFDADLIEKKIVQGSPVQVGERLLRIVDHSTLWLEAQIQEPQIPLVAPGQEVSAEVGGFPGKVFKGSVVLVLPHVDPATRTATARIEIPNADRALKPGMYARIRFDLLAAPRAILVPREAILDTGTRRIAFVKGATPGVFTPRTVRVGASGNDGMVQILDGLAPGDEVVVSGQLLLDAESRTSEAQRKMTPVENTGPGERPKPAPPPAPRHGP